MNKEELKQYIDENVYENQDGEITGESLNAVLKAIVDEGGTDVEANPEEAPSAIILDALRVGEQVYMIPTPLDVDTQLSDTSVNPVQNKVVKQALDGKANTSSLAAKQDTLVSGTNIKTINQNSLLGSGDITIEGGGTEVVANPEGDATTPLNKIKIGETNYTIPQTDTSNLATKQELQQGLSGKQDTIADLQQIRTRANEGHTAVQPSEMEEAIDAVNPFAGEVDATDAERLQALANISNQDAGYDSSEPPVFTGKMGYVVLQPEKEGDTTTTFAAQIANKPNTIFEVRDVYNLDPNEVTDKKTLSSISDYLRIGGYWYYYDESTTIRVEPSKSPSSKMALLSNYLLNDNRDVAVLPKTAITTDSDMYPAVRESAAADYKIGTAASVTIYLTESIEIDNETYFKCITGISLASGKKITASGCVILNDSNAIIGTGSYTAQSDTTVYIARKAKTFDAISFKVVPYYEIPANCTLKFNGGMLKNGTLVGDSKSSIISNAKCLDSVTLYGFDGVFYARWFGDDLTKVFPYVHNCELHLDGITYQLSQDILVEIGTRIIGHNTTINSSAHFYCGWRTKIRGINFISTNTSVECITILGSKIYESRQHFTDYEDGNFLIIGIEIENCIFKSASKGIVFEPSVVSNGIDKNFFNGSGFSFHIHNNQFNEMSGDLIYVNKVNGWFNGFEIVENVCNSGRIFFHAVSTEGAVTGINILRNDVQLTDTYPCAVKLEAARAVNITGNRFWDVYNGAVQVSKDNCEGVFVEIPAKGENTNQYIKYFDKQYTGTTILSSVNTSSIYSTDFVGILPDPSHGSGDNKYYCLADFLYYPLGNYKVPNIKLPYLIGDWPGLTGNITNNDAVRNGGMGWVLNISRPSFRQLFLELYPMSKSFGFFNAEGIATANQLASIKFCATVNTDSNDYINTTEKVGLLTWRVILSPFSSVTPQFALPAGTVYYDRTVGTLAYSDNNKVLKSYDGSTLGAKKYGTTADRPSGDKIYVGFQYFDTSLSPARPIYASAIASTDPYTVTWVDAIGATV